MLIYFVSYGLKILQNKTIAYYFSKEWIRRISKRRSRDCPSMKKGLPLCVRTKVVSQQCTGTCALPVLYYFELLLLQLFHATLPLIKDQETAFPPRTFAFIPRILIFVMLHHHSKVLK